MLFEIQKLTDPGYQAKLRRIPWSHDQHLFKYNFYLFLPNMWARGGIVIRDI